MIPFMALAALGFAISLGVHLLALSGRLPPGGKAVYAMHFGLFVVWIPAVLVAMRLSQGQRSRLSWDQILDGCPAWMRYAAMGLFGYAFLNFFLAFGIPAQNNFGGELTPEVLRGFSGHWMLFYGLAFATLLSAYRKPRLRTSAKCPAGHEVAHSDSTCPTCGTALPAPRTRGAADPPLRGRGTV
jgi:hypothetical protein